MFEFDKDILFACTDFEKAVEEGNNVGRIWITYPLKFLLDGIDDFMKCSWKFPMWITVGERMIGGIGVTTADQLVVENLEFVIDDLLLHGLS